MMAATTNPLIRRILERALAGEPLNATDGYALIEAQSGDLATVMTVASALRDRYKGRDVTFSRKVFIPLTNLCRDKCGYCIFARPPSDPEAHTMTPEEVLSVARAGAQAGCKEALFSLGDKPEAVHALARKHLAALGYASTHDYLVAMCRLVLEEVGLLPHANPGVMTNEEMAALRPVTGSMGLMLESISERLMEPGEAHYGCSDKAPAARLETIAQAGRLKIPFTTGILIGIGETRRERVDSLLAIRGLHEHYGHIQEVIIQNFRAKPETRFRYREEPGVLEMIRTIATARLLLGDMNIQAPPNLTPQAYPLYLLAGINDWGGISPVTRDFINPEAAWPKIMELKQVTENAGFRLRERLALYPEYIRRGQEFCDPALRPRIELWADEAGYVREEAIQW